MFALELRFRQVLLSTYFFIFSLLIHSLKLYPRLFCSKCVTTLGFEAMDLSCISASTRL